ncbi:MAG TPA: hypothetical protein PLD88_06630 [Candidatus Berkiella sp.]|nr:hypothetical protein [Candidatus Berkiella sp.]
MSSKGPQKPASYAFAQQIDSSCHTMPFINLSILQQLRSASLEEHKELDLKEHAKWYNKRQWLPQTFLWTKEWQLAMKRAMDTPFGEYQKKMLEEGIINGHVYDAGGNRYDNTWNPIENYARMLLVPYNFTDASTLPVDLGFNHVDAAYKTLPLFLHEGKAIAYDPEKGDYQALIEVESQDKIDSGEWDIALFTTPPITPDVSTSTSSSSNASTWQQTFGEYSEMLDEYYESISEASQKVSQYFKPERYVHPGSFQSEPSPYFPTSKQNCRFYQLTPAQKDFLSLPAYATLAYTSNSTLGYDIAFKYRYLPSESEQHSYYQSSLLQLMLLCMGVDNQNNTIDQTHPLYAAHIALKAEMESSPHNPWALPSFQKENLLEYQIAKMIQSDPELKSAMKETANIFFPAWEYYQNLRDCYDSPDPVTRKPLREKMNWLLGEDLYLAYIYVMNARFLWAAATSREAFSAILELDPTLARMLQLPFTPGPNFIMRNAQRRSANGLSFLDVWQRIQANLVVNPKIPKELASFSGHGIAISLYNDLYEQQIKNVSNPDIMKRLGFSVIDSYYGEQLSPMYRQASGKTSQETCDLDKLTEIFSPRRRHQI